MIVETDDKMTATQVKEAVYDGKLPDVFIERGAIISVTRYHAPSIG